VKKNKLCTCIKLKQENTYTFNWENENYIQNVSRKLERKYNFGDLGIDGRILLKQILMWAGLNWLRIGLL
jgi:hypothetical protein